MNRIAEHFSRPQTKWAYGLTIVLLPPAFFVFRGFFVWSANHVDYARFEHCIYLNRECSALASSWVSSFSTYLAFGAAFFAALSAFLTDRREGFREVVFERVKSSASLPKDADLRFLAKVREGPFQLERDPGTELKHYISIPFILKNLGRSAVAMQTANLELRTAQNAITICRVENICIAAQSNVTLVLYFHTTLKGMQGTWTAFTDKNIKLHSPEQSFIIANSAAFKNIRTQSRAPVVDNKKKA